MDTIRFELVRSTRGEARLGIRVNGVDLIALTAREEEPFAAAEGAPIAGGYAGLTIGPGIGRPSLDLLPHAAGSDVGPAKVRILECASCGMPGCWDLLCRITADGSVVVWSDFEQPHRTADFGPTEWRYDGLGPFRFDRRAYEAALAAIEL